MLYGVPHMRMPDREQRQHAQSFIAATSDMCSGNHKVSMKSASGPRLISLAFRRRRRRRRRALTFSISLVRRPGRAPPRQPLAAQERLLPLQRLLYAHERARRPQHLAEPRRDSDLAVAILVGRLADRPRRRAVPAQSSRCHVPPPRQRTRRAPRRRAHRQQQRRRPRLGHRARLHGAPSVVPCPSLDAVGPGAALRRAGEEAQAGQVRRHVELAPTVPPHLVQPVLLHVSLSSRRPREALSRSHKLSVLVSQKSRGRKCMIWHALEARSG